MGYSKWGTEAKRTARRAIGHCQICLRGPRELGRAIDDCLVMDHDHRASGWDIRGILCTSCNVMIHYMEEIARPGEDTREKVEVYYREHARIIGLEFGEWFERAREYVNDHGREFRARYNNYKETMGTTLAPEERGICGTYTVLDGLDLIEAWLKDGTGMTEDRAGDVCTYLEEAQWKVGDLITRVKSMVLTPGGEPG